MKKKKEKEKKKKKKKKKKEKKRKNFVSHFKAIKSYEILEAKFSINNFFEKSVERRNTALSWGVNDSFSGFRLVIVSRQFAFLMCLLPCSQNETQNYAVIYVRVCVRRIRDRSEVICQNF